jgi:hypothetical protein
MGAEAFGRSGPLIDWGVAARTLRGYARSGDIHVVQPFPGGVLVAAVDGLGHGDEAAEAATIAAAVLSTHASEPIAPLVRRCHEGLTGTRGVAMSLARFAEGSPTVSWLGVGNVEATFFSTDSRSNSGRQSLPLRGGVVGYRLPTLLTSEAVVAPGDVLVLTTDGINAGSLPGVRLFDSPRRIAQDILERFGRETDDALALVVRYQGRAA